jgi:hypothetical protein
MWLYIQTWLPLLSIGPPRGPGLLVWGRYGANSTEGYEQREKGKPRAGAHAAGFALGARAG